MGGPAWGRCGLLRLKWCAPGPGDVHLQYALGQLGRLRQPGRRGADIRDPMTTPAQGHARPLTLGIVGERLHAGVSAAGVSAAGTGPC